MEGVVKLHNKGLWG